MIGAKASMLVFLGPAGLVLNSSINGGTFTNQQSISDLADAALHRQTAAMSLGNDVLCARLDMLDQEGKGVGTV
jgi:hypothetical protein